MTVKRTKKLVQKLPDWAISRWNRQVTQALSQNQEFPTFQEFATLVATEAEIACNPITSFYALRSSDTVMEKRNLKESNGEKVRVFNTQTNSEDRSETERPPERPPCPFCQDNNHQIYNCTKFTDTDLEERRTFVQERRLCYGCLRPGHSARDCSHRHTCNSCKGRHPTSLHDSNYVKQTKASPSVDPQRVLNEARATALNVATGQNTNTSMIVPVWVSTRKNPSNEKLVYALIDTQSDTTFIDEAVSHAIQADSYPVKLKLTTMLDKDTVLQTRKVTGLQVRSYSSANHIDLPPAYTRDCIPVNRTHIPTCETAKCWSHLVTIAKEIPSLQDCEIGLLIGYNCSRAMAPQKVIVGGDEEPYGIETDL